MHFHAELSSSENHYNNHKNHWHHKKDTEISTEIWNNRFLLKVVQ